VRFLLAHPAHFIALGLRLGAQPHRAGHGGHPVGLGRLPGAADLVHARGAGLHRGGDVPAGLVGRDRHGRNMRVLDPGSIVIDEVMAFWAVLWLLLPAGWGAQLAAFAIFRFFDAVKPGPVGWADSRFHGFGWRGGWGIVFDDLVAAFCTLLVLALWRSLT
jgi:phosphatidylglycerophosphatase A